MRVEVDFSRLDELRAMLGPPRQMNVPLPPMVNPVGRESLLLRLRQGIKTYSLENMDLYGSFLTYQSVPVAVHIWTFPQREPERVVEGAFRDKRYHIVWCQVIDRMHRAGRFYGQLMYARPADNRFHVEYSSAGKQISVRTPFPVCRSCLSTIGQLRFWTLPWVRSQIVRKFNLHDFFARAERELPHHEHRIVTPAD